MFILTRIAWWVELWDAWKDIFLVICWFLMDRTCEKRGEVNGCAEGETI